MQLVAPHLQALKQTAAILSPAAMLAWLWSLVFGIAVQRRGAIHQVKLLQVMLHHLFLGWSCNGKSFWKPGVTTKSKSYEHVLKP